MVAIDNNTQPSVPKKELPLLVIIGYTHGWPRFEVKFDGTEVNVDSMNKYLEPYGYKINKM